MAEGSVPVGLRQADAAKERRLTELRLEAERTGRVTAPGVRAAGGPLPDTGALPGTDAASGYYGLPLLKEPTWIWTIPVYFFVGGAAGAAAVIAEVARWTRGNTSLVRDARRLAAAGGALSPVLLIADLGRPERFLSMLRVVKPQSPMSVGVWVLVGFNAAADAGVVMRYLGRRQEHRVLRGTLKAAGEAADGVAATLGGIVSTYTGVLIGVTTIPVWARNVRLLPLHFGMSGLASASCLLELLHDDPALHRIGVVAASAETAVGALLELDRHPAQEPVKHGASGRLTRLGGLLSGPAALAIRAFAGGNRDGRRAAALVSLAGSLITRFAWMAAGRQAAREHIPAHNPQA